MIIRLLFILSVTSLLFGCKKESHTTESNTSNAKLVFIFKFDSSQVRLNNIGQPATIPAGRSSQSPVMNKMGAHYIEMAPGDLTPLGFGAVLYRAEETTAGGESAIDYEKERYAGNNEVFLEVPLKDVPKGDYKWLRISLAYQNADVKYRIDTTISGININQDFTATLAGFIGFNHYIKNFTIKNQTIPVNSNKKQGFWGFETTITAAGLSLPHNSTGQAPANVTTVVNPLFATSPIPPGSCVVTAKFVPGMLKITGNETSDIIIETSFSINNSFEWEDTFPNRKWEPLKGEKLFDMGIRGLVPTIK